MILMALSDDNGIIVLLVHIDVVGLFSHCSHGPHMHLAEYTNKRLHNIRHWPVRSNDLLLDMYWPTRYLVPFCLLPTWGVKPEVILATCVATILASARRPGICLVFVTNQEQNNITISTFDKGVAILHSIIHRREKLGRLQGSLAVSECSAI